MTLLEKFENVYIDFQIQAGIIKYNELYEASNQCEKIADDYAIEFQKWVDTNYFKHNTFTETTSTEEMLKIFKKEKGL
jgi:hypothetical protein